MHTFASIVVFIALWWWFCTTFFPSAPPPPSAPKPPRRPGATKAFIAQEFLGIGVSPIELAIVCVRNASLVLAAWFVWLFLSAIVAPTPVAHGSQIDFAKMPASTDPWKDFNLQPMPPPPASKPTAIRPAAPGPIHIPLQDVAPVPPLPAPQAGGWGVDDTSGPWPADEIRAGSARADRLLRRFHQAQGVEMGG